LPNFYEILRFYTRPWEALKFLIWSLSGDKQPSYKHFPAVGAFSLNISIAPSGDTFVHLYSPEVSTVRAFWRIVTNSRILVVCICVTFVIFTA